MLTDGARWADSLVGATRAVREATTIAGDAAIALGYLERHRIGLGSPFRLVELALADTRLVSGTRRRLGWALLERTRRGEGYVIEASVLSATTAPLDIERAGAHAELIGRAVRRANDPRVGEMAVRLAYPMAAAEGIVAPSALSRVLRVAAMERDRVTAQTDVKRLLRSAQGLEDDPLVLTATWRRERWFVVERPPAADGLGPDRMAIERTAIRMVEPLLDTLRILSDNRNAPASLRAVGRPLLGLGAARRLASAAHRAAPPVTPIVVALRGEHAQAGQLPSDLLRARTEETLVAVHASLTAVDAATPGTARVLLDAAVAMRAFAQEPVWLPGAGPAPSVDDVARSLGLLAVEFDRGVPAGWRPYYLRMLTSSVADLQRVLPDASFDGLRVRFVSGARGTALAIHEPRSRTIVFPIETAAGTIAHELAHDLDWQAARALYRRRGTYGSDVAVSRRDGKLAESLRGLTAARLIPPDVQNRYRPPHQQRPAEVFARNVDWFVAAALAREGRSNGYLSAVQDEALTGYASVLPREVGGGGGVALMDALEEMAYVSEDTRDWFLEHWGATRALRPAAVVREAVSLSPRRNWSATPGSFRFALPPSRSIDAPIRDAVAACADRPSASSGSSASLAWLALDARARGIVRARAHWYRGTHRPAWAHAVLEIAPWSPSLADDAVRRTRAQLLTQLRAGNDLSEVFDLGQLPTVSASCRPTGRR